jgi:hypothetical protein
LRLGHPVAGRNDQADTCLSIHRCTTFLFLLSRKASKSSRNSLVPLFHKLSFPCQASFESAKAIR